MSTVSPLKPNPTTNKAKCPGAPVKACERPTFFDNLPPKQLFRGSYMAATDVVAQAVKERRATFGYQLPPSAALLDALHSSTK